MSPGGARRAAPAPVRRVAIRMLGWLYWARRRIRARAARPARGAGTGPGPGGAVGSDHGTAAAPAGNAAGPGSVGEVAVGSPAQAQASLPPDAPESVIAGNEHGLYCVPLASQHRPVAQAILQARVWEEETLDLVRGSDSEGDIVHAGTFFGDFIPALARSRANGALVWAFEPGRENHRCTEITIALNELDNVVLSYAGLGAEGGRALLATSDRDGVPLGGASRVISDPARARWWENEQVELLALDAAIGEDRRIAAVQLDVEGHEQQALAGALRTIARCRPLIVLETLPAADWLAANLAPLGYRSAGQVNRNHVLRCD